MNGNSGWDDGPSDSDIRAIERMKSEIPELKRVAQVTKAEIDELRATTDALIAGVKGEIGELRVAAMEAMVAVLRVTADVLTEQLEALHREQHS